MVELVALSPFGGLLPVTVGACHLKEVSMGPLATIAPFAGKQEEVSAALMARHGVAFPAPNRATRKDGVQVLWFGRDMAMLAGVAPDAELTGLAAITDQSDAWACAVLTGAGHDQVLARLVPVDLRPAVFGPEQTCRTLLGHMPASITRLTADSVLVLVYRSMAGTFMHEMQEAMEAFAARR